MDRALLADFLRARREVLQPEDVGLPRGPRRRTGGLRREEVAALAGMSVDYYSRIEQQRGPMPSEQVLAGLARGLHLSLSERDHLFDLAGHSAPRRVLRGDHVSPTMMRIVERLADTPALVMSRFNETLLQTRPAIALLGDYTRFSGMSRYLVYRWFTDPAQRALYPAEDHALRGRVFTVDLRTVYTADPQGRAGEIVAALLATSAEFAEVWRLHEVDVTHHNDLKRYRHPELGELELYCQRLIDPDQAQELLVFSATPGSPSYEKLQLLPAVGAQASHDPKVLRKDFP
ncbi:helix-turn-helix transcriptional regulator [Streptomyces canus]|uniref:helix-turn-helix transcriptional regulator n=1 Tax=Streptomyces canus TaxID=58343 RepID=UPI00277F6472|nr:helix-turn-helix transcriptional regulator [Streptomyces canus]MDQ0761583.1 transcriptional regulator with XRE-family HTH domain [Streptomyces canus]MDQ1069837.1 transcriptional regulator with XRE-family HTH domain [Streptomyces canus]